MRGRAGLVIFLAAVLCFGMACKPKLKITANPLNPLPNQPITFTVRATDSSGIAVLKIEVNGALVKTCVQTTTCSFTASYAAFDQSVVSYQGFARDNSGYIAKSGPFMLAVGRPWNNQTWIPVRGSSLAAPDAIDICFGGDSDYGGDIVTLLVHVSDKIYNRYLETDGIKDHQRKYKFFYTATPMSADNCGAVLSNLPTIGAGGHCDVFAVLHQDDFRDCSNGPIFTAEGNNTKAFIHESGHAIFDLADEYEGDTSYFMTSPHPNIFQDFFQVGSTGKVLCEAEVATDNLNPLLCDEFCDSLVFCAWGWWRHTTFVTIMSQGFFDQPWGRQPKRRVDWVHAKY